jgi:hypothetical protein
VQTELWLRNIWVTFKVCLAQSKNVLCRQRLTVNFWKIFGEKFKFSGKLPTPQNDVGEYAIHSRWYYRISTSKLLVTPATIHPKAAIFVFSTRLYSPTGRLLLG